jgi:glycosyltransferase involved in cell wall biosynthesis
VSRRIVVLDSHQWNDNRISKHISSVKRQYDVFRVNVNFYPDRVPPKGGTENSFILNFTPTRNPYLNGSLFTVKTSLRGVTGQLEKKLREEFVQKGDEVVFHLHDPYLLGLAVRLSIRFPRSAVVYDRHEYYETWKNRLGISVPGFFERWYGKRVAEIVFVSRSVQDLPEVFSGKKVSVVPNYPLSKDFDADAVQRKIKDMDASEHVNLVYFGVLNLGFDRDIELMFQLMTSLMRAEARLTFTVAGRVYDQKIVGMIDGMVQEFGDRMSYLGEISNREVIRYTQSAHLGFFLLSPNSPMWSESRPVSPNKVYEYLLSGTIPILRAILDDREVIEKCALTFGKDSSAQEIEGVVLGLCRDKERMKSMMQQCYSTGLGYTWEGVADRYLECYQRIFEAMKDRS